MRLFKVKSSMRWYFSEAYRSGKTFLQASCLNYKQVLISLSITLNPYKKRNLRANNLKSISLNREKVAPRRGAPARPAEQNTKV